MDRPVQENYNVLLLVFDTLRPDFLSCYENQTRVSTENLDSLAQDGVLFERAYSAGHHTRISHGSLFTGQYPTQNGLIEGHAQINQTSPYLPEHLSENGYQTYGISGPSLISSDYGFDRGFDTYLEPYYEGIQPKKQREYFESVVDDENVRRDFLRLLQDGEDDITNLKFKLLEESIDDSDEDRPYFGFVNFLTVHSPYDPPRPYKERVTEELDFVDYDRPRWVLFEYLAGLVGKSLEKLDGATIRPDHVFAAADGFGGPYHGDQSWLTDDEMEILRTWYSGCLKYLDDQLGQFIDFLKSREMYEDTLLILTSDHGEHFGEHDLLYHGDFLFNEVVQVPLILSGGPVEEARRSDLASHVDIFDTVCDVVGIEPSPETSGRSLLGEEQRQSIFAEYGVREDYGRNSRYSVNLNSAELKLREMGMKCVRTEDYKLVLRSDGNYRLYDQPDENRVTDAPDSVIDEHLSLIEDELGREFRDSRFVDTEDVSDEMKQNLEDLGYI